MRPVLVKVYGNLYPVPEECFAQAEQITQSWGLSDVVELRKDMILFSFEGDYFPCDEISELLQSFHTDKTDGKLDCINIEEWTLTRHFFKLGEAYRVNTASLDNAIEKTKLQ